MTDSEKLRAQLESLLLPRTMLHLHKAPKPADTQLLSHSGGEPYFEQGETWPVNPQTGQPLECIFQLVNDGTLVLPFPAAIVQLYYDYHGEEVIFDGSQEEGYLVKIYESISPDKLAAVPRPASLPAVQYESITFERAPSLPDAEELDQISAATYALCRQINADDWQDVYNAAVEELIGEQDLGSWVGGYANWLQGAYPPDAFLLQFDSTENFMWGDSGLLYFFYDPENVRDITFELQCC